MGSKEQESTEIKQENSVKHQEYCNVFQEYVFIPECTQDYVADDIWTGPPFDESLNYLVGGMYHGAFDLLQPEMYIKPEHVLLNSVETIKEEEEEAKPIRKTDGYCLQKKKITAYDSETTSYLQSVFFETYSKQSKLTKQQRREVQEKTGLPSRNITYWFSNHKRRFQDSLNKFRRTNRSSSLTYQDFIKWRKKQDVSNRKCK
ncbi:unnamed protein product [Rhizopus stolonifer]